MSDVRAADVEGGSRPPLWESDEPFRIYGVLIITGAQVSFRCRSFWDRVTLLTTGRAYGRDIAFGPTMATVNPAPVPKPAPQHASEVPRASPDGAERKVEPTETSARPSPELNRETE